MRKGSELTSRPRLSRHYLNWHHIRWGGVCASSPEIYLNENGVFCALWNTVLKLMCLQRKASYQTSMHSACRLGRACDAMGNRRMPLNTPLFVRTVTDRRVDESRVKSPIMEVRSQAQTFELTFQYTVVIGKRQRKLTFLCTYRKI